MSGNLTNLERVIAKNPTSSLFARLADAYLQQGDIHRAIEICRQGIRYRPSYVSGHVVLGKSHFAAGMFEEARRAFNKVLHLDPHHTVAVWYLGQIDRTMGWDDLALRNFQKARDLDPLSQSLQRAIDEVLTSISNQMGQRLRDEVAEPHLQDRSERETDVEGQIVEAPGSAPATDGAEVQGEGRGISRLVDEIEANIAQASGAMGPSSEGRAGLAGEEDGARNGLPSAAPEASPHTGSGGDSEESILSDLRAVAPPLFQPPGRGTGGERRGSGESSAGPGRGRSGETPGIDGKLRGGSVQEGLPIVTATLAEIYAGQGLIAQAVAILEKVVEREPGNAPARERLSALRSQLTASTSP